MERWKKSRYQPEVIGDEVRVVYRVLAGNATVGDVLDAFNDPLAYAIFEGGEFSAEIVDAEETVKIDKAGAEAVKEYVTQESSSKDGIIDTAMKPLSLAAQIPYTAGRKSIEYNFDMPYIDWEDIPYVRTIHPEAAAYGSKRVTEASLGLEGLNVMYKFATTGAMDANVGAGVTAGAGFVSWKGLEGRIDAEWEKMVESYVSELDKVPLYAVEPID